MKKKSNVYRDHHGCQTYIRTFFKTNRRTAMHSLKSIETMSLLRDVQKSIGAIVGNFQEKIEGNIHPQSVGDLCLSNTVFVHPISLNSELLWFSSYLNRYADEIIFYLDRKNRFEHSLMCGEFSVCRALLEEVKNRVGLSLWYYECMFLLYEYEGNKSEGIKFLSQTLESAKEKHNTHIPYLIYKLHERATRNLSPYKYDDDLTSLYKQNKTDLHDDYYKYLLFRLNYYNQYIQEDLSTNMMFESLSSIVDRYNMSILLIKTEILQKRADEITFHRARYLYSKTKDKDLLPVLAIGGIKLPVDYYNGGFVEILDLYYKGDYVDAIESCKVFLKEQTSIYDVCLIYCRSLIYLDLDYVDPLQSNGAPINRICRLSYNVIKERENSDDLYALYQMTKNLYSFHISSSLNHFIKTESNEPLDRNLKYLWMTCFDPAAYECISDLSNKEQGTLYLEYGHKHFFSSSVACKVNYARLNEDVCDDADVSENIQSSHNASVAQCHGDYLNAYKLWEDINNQVNACLPIRQNAVKNMIDCVFKSGDVQGAITLYVDCLLHDAASVKKVDTQSIIKYLQDKLYEDIRRNIDLAIFMGLNCKESVEKSFILLEYCEIKGVERPSELIGMLYDDQARQEAFFDLMNDDETLRHYFNIGSFKGRLLERQKILNHLISLNSINKESYEKSLKEVEDALLVYRVSKNLSEGKIYANEQAIIKYKLNEIEGLYNRFLHFYRLLVNEKSLIYVVDINRSFILQTDKGYESESDSKLSISNNGIYEVFYSLYSYIRDKFLFSEYGLVAYLSTRVRHGELESQLRPELSQRDLILQIKDEQYQPTNRWKYEYSLSAADDITVNTALMNFSKGFDATVSDLIKKKLQIKDDTHSEGLFVYDCDESELTIKAIELGYVANEKGMDEFIKCIFKWLWQKTDANLVNIREYVSNEFAIKINDLFENLKTDLSKEKLPTGHIHEAIQATITDASSAVNGKVKIVECWFNTTTNKLEDVDIKQLTYQVYNNIRTAFPHIEITTVPKIEGDSFKLKSNFVLHYADLLRNVMTNMFKYGLPSAEGNYDFVMEFQIDNEVLNVHFQNNIDPLKVDELNEIFKKKLTNEAAIFNGEGGSGIAKASKILKSDFQNHNNSIEQYAVEDKCNTEIRIHLNNIKANEKDTNCRG